MTGYEVRTTTPDGQLGVTVGFIDEHDTMSFLSAIREGRFTVVEVVLSERVVHVEALIKPLGEGGCFCARDADGAVIRPYGGCPIHGGVWARTPDSAATVGETPTDAMHVGGVVCTCEWTDTPDPECPIHGESAQ